MIFYNLFGSIAALTGAVQTLTDNCVTGITANEKRCRELLEASVGIVTALNPYIGYKKSAEIAKKSLKTGISVRELVLQEKILSKEEMDVILNPYKMTSPANELKEAVNS